MLLLRFSPGSTLWATAHRAVNVSSRVEKIDKYTLHFKHTVIPNTQTCLPPLSLLRCRGAGPPAEQHAVCSWLGGPLRRVGCARPMNTVILGPMQPARHKAIQHARTAATALLLSGHRRAHCVTVVISEGLARADHMHVVAALKGIGCGAEAGDVHGFGGSVGILVGFHAAVYLYCHLFTITSTPSPQYQSVTTGKTTVSNSKYVENYNKRPLSRTCSSLSNCLKL
jgi:hypothetical protein